jgi:DNA-binding XRE family transcriptional regulator
MPALLVTSCGQMTPEQFTRWRKHMGVTKEKAGEFLGLSSKKIALHEAGTRIVEGKEKTVLVPLTVELGCYALAAGVRNYDGPDYAPRR